MSNDYSTSNYFMWDTFTSTLALGTSTDKRDWRQSPKTRRFSGPVSFNCVHAVTTITEPEKRLALGDCLQSLLSVLVPKARVLL